ncbi:DUF6487 domain-containing protein, partial [Dysosmobacter welbionis]
RLEDLGVQSQRDLRPQRRLLRVLQLFDLGMEGLDLLLAVQRRLVRVDQRHHAAVADPLALRPLQLQQAAGVVRQDRLVP